MLILLPRTSDKSQPLDGTLYGPLKEKHGFYNKEVDKWITNYSKKTLTIFEIDIVMGAAYSKAFTSSNIISGFRCTEIYPLNPHIFNEQAFMSSYIIDQPFGSIATGELVANSSVSTPIENKDVPDRMLPVFTPLHVSAN